MLAPVNKQYLCPETTQLTSLLFMFIFDQFYMWIGIFFLFFDKKNTFLCPFKYFSSLETHFSCCFVGRVWSTVDAAMAVKSSSATQQKQHCTGRVSPPLSILSVSVETGLEPERVGFQERFRRSTLISEPIQNTHPTQADFHQPQTSLQKLQTWQAIICRGQSNGLPHLPVCVLTTLPSTDKPRDVGFSTSCSSLSDRPLRALPKHSRPYLLELRINGCPPCKMEMIYAPRRPSPWFTEMCKQPM